VRLLIQIAGYGERSNRAPWPQGCVVGKAVALVASRTVAFRGPGAWKYAAVLSTPLSRSLRGSGRLGPCEATTARS
jgi:hypothetical protein